MIGTAETLQESARCTLCPAGCELQLARTGPDRWRSEFPQKAGSGLCPRGSTLGELVNHRRRILQSFTRHGTRTEPLSLAAAFERINSAAADGLTLLVDGNLPFRQIASIGAWCRARPKVQLCFVIDPGESDMLLGTEASGAEYISDDSLAECDGFVIIGDAFAANPRCSRGVLDRRRQEPRTPIVVIDPGCGTADKFATHRVVAEPGMELAALGVVARCAGVEVDLPGGASPAEMPSAAAAGEAIAECRKLGVIVAAEYGRSNAWRQTGFLAGSLAEAHDGGIAPQTTGANALAALRMAARLGAVTLGEALSSGPSAVVAVGCDVLSMLGWSTLPGNKRIIAAAAALPNTCTDTAEIVMPLALGCELAGSYLFAGERQVEVAPLLKIPAGVATPAEIVASLAGGGTGRQEMPNVAELLERIDSPASMEVTLPTDPESPVLLLGRQAMHQGAGSITRHGTWQTAIGSVPHVRINPEDAAEMGVANLSTITVRVGDRQLLTAVQYAPEVNPGLVVIDDGYAGARLLMPCVLQADGSVAAVPTTAELITGA